MMGFLYLFLSGRTTVCFMGIFTDLAWEWEWFLIHDHGGEFSETCHGSYSFLGNAITPFFFSFESSGFLVALGVRHSVL